MFSYRIPVNFKNVVYQTAMRYGSEEEWKKLYDISIKTTDNSERLRILRGLAATRDFNLLKLYHPFLFTLNIIPQLSIFHLIRKFVV